MNKNIRLYASSRHQHGGLRKTILAAIGLLTIALANAEVVISIAATDSTVSNY